MRRTYWKVPVFGIVFLALVSDASAECAWVLWSKKEYQFNRKAPVSVEWRIHKAFKNQEECEALKKTEWEKLPFQSESLAFDELERVPYDGVFRRLKKGGFWNDQLYCLPDTIDPREKARREN